MVVHVALEACGVDRHKLARLMLALELCLEQLVVLRHDVVLQPGGLDGEEGAVLVGAFVLPFVGFLVQLLVLCETAWISRRELAVPMATNQGLCTFVRQVLSKMDLKYKFREYFHNLMDDNSLRPK